MRMMRWASELAIKPEKDAAALGVGTLGALLHSELLQEEDKPLVDVVLKAVLADAKADIVGAIETGEAFDVALEDE